MTIDERLEMLGIRIEGLVMNAELANREIEAWRESTRRATEEIHSIIRGLAVRHEVLIERHEALTQRHEAQ